MLKRLSVLIFIVLLSALCCINASAATSGYFTYEIENNQAIITGKSAFADFTLFGRTPNFILSKRVTPNFTKKEGTIEEICADIVSDAFFDVENFVVKRTSGFTNSINFWRNVYNPTFKVISECLDREKAGH